MSDAHTSTIPPHKQAQWSHIWHLSWPIMISNLSQPLVGAADTAMMGHLPDPAGIGGVALGTLVVHFIVMLFSFLRMSTTALTSQAYGKRDDAAILRPLQRGLMIGLGAGLIALLAHDPLISLSLIILPASEAVEGYMVDYIAIQLFALPAILMNTALLGWLYGLQSMRIGMVQLLLVNGLNILLNFVFVLGFDAGIQGVALASVIANWVGLLCILPFVHRHFARYLAGLLRLKDALAQGGWQAYASLSRDILIRTLLLYLVEAILLSSGGKTGDVALASLQVTMVIFFMIAYALDGFAHASEALVGTAVGRDDKALLSQTIWRATSLAFLVSLIITAFLWLAQPVILSLLTSQTEVIAYMDGLWFYVLLLAPLSVLAFQMDGIFIGAALGHALRNSMMISFATFVGSLWLFGYFGDAPLAFPAGTLDGVVIAFILYLAMRGISLTLFLPQLYRRLSTS